MRFLAISPGLLVALLVSACDLWPKELKPLSESITQQVSGDTIAWLVSGDVVVIEVAGSPSYRIPQAELEALATGIAGQAIEYSAAPLESIIINFHEGEVSDNPEKIREFIFLVMENRPVLQPYLDLDATGPLTVDEIRAAIDRLDESYAGLGNSLAGEQRECILAEVEQRAYDAGEPETLDPSSVDFLTAETWYELDAFSRRIVLMQAILTKALFLCVSTGKAEVSSRKAAASGRFQNS